MGSTCNTSKENPCARDAHKFPVRHGCVCSHTVCMHRNNVHANFFIAGSLQPQHFVIKVYVYPKYPLQISRFFLCNQDVCACTMGCERGFKWTLYMDFACLKMSRLSILSFRLPTSPFWCVHVSLAHESSWQFFPNNPHPPPTKK